MKKLWSKCLSAVLALAITILGVPAYADEYEELSIEEFVYDGSSQEVRRTKIEAQTAYVSVDSREEANLKVESFNLDDALNIVSVMPYYSENQIKVDLSFLFDYVYGRGNSIEVTIFNPSNKLPVYAGEVYAADDFSGTICGLEKNVVYSLYCLQTNGTHTYAYHGEFIIFGEDILKGDISVVEESYKNQENIMIDLNSLESKTTDASVALGSMKAGTIKTPTSFILPEDGAFSTGDVVPLSVTRNEAEPNNSMALADRIYDDDTMYGTIGQSGDVDFFVVSFNREGNVNFWLGDIPSGKDYDLILYNSNGKEIASSKTTSGQEQIFNFRVEADRDYYLKVYGYGNSYHATARYRVRAKLYQSTNSQRDRAYSTYALTSPYRSYMKDRMNCYGYATHVYYRDQFPVNSNGITVSSYKQQPGEFYNSNESYNSLMTSYLNAFTKWNNALSFITDRIYEDFSTLNEEESGEWEIQITSPTQTVPTGYRKIALTIGYSVGSVFDYHFYLRHNDGTWSHKPGSESITNRSFGGSTITDSNIQMVATQGGYDDGLVFFLIKKSAIPDYPHGAGQSSTSLRTPLYFANSDGAGDSIKRSAGLSTDNTCRFDYPGDVDYFEFTPTSSGTYRFYCDNKSSTYDLDAELYNQSGTRIQYDTSVGNFNFSYSLTGGQTYFIKTWDAKSNVIGYSLFVRKS